MRTLTVVALLWALASGCGHGIHDDQSTEASASTSSTVTTYPPPTSEPTVTTFTTNSTTETSTTDETGCSFACHPDGYAPPECSVTEQDCDEGFKCTAYDSDGNGSWDEVKCVEVTGDAVHGEPCTADGPATGDDTCAKGHLCWQVDENNEGVCVAYCTGPRADLSCEPTKTYCALGSDGPLKLCLPGCDPLGDDCPEGDLCLPSPPQEVFRCVLDASGGMAPTGTPCEFANTCNPGLHCSDTADFPGVDCADAPGCCSPFCDVKAPDPCAGLEGVLQMGQTATCVALFEEEEAFEGWEHIGTCAVP